MLKLMIVDDEAIIVKGLQHVIRRMKTPFTDIVGVSDSVEALRMAEEFKPDLLITDIQMPEPERTGFNPIGFGKESRFQIYYFDRLRNV